MTFTTLWANDNWPTSRTTINGNFTDAQTQIDTKVTYSGTVPADGDLVVASGITGKIIKKKVFTASQVLESDVSGQPTSAAKGTGYNKNLGTSSGTVLEWSNDALYAKLAGTQTITGDKTFSGITAAVTQSPWDSSTKVATTEFVTLASSIAYTVNASETANAYYTFEAPILFSAANACAGWTCTTVTASSFNTATGYTALTGSGGAGFILSWLLGWCWADLAYTHTTTKTIRIKTRMLFDNMSNRRGFGMVTASGTIYTAQTDTTNGSIRFIQNAWNVYAQNSNGTTSTTTDVTGSYTFTNWNIFEIVYLPWTSAKFYINGTLVATHTTNLPTTWNPVLAYGNDTGGRTIGATHPIISLEL